MKRDEVLVVELDDAARELDQQTIGSRPLSTVPRSPLVDAAAWIVEAQHDDVAGADRLFAADQLVAVESAGVAHRDAGETVEGSHVASAQRDHDAAVGTAARPPVG